MRAITFIIITATLISACSGAANPGPADNPESIISIETQVLLDDEDFNPFLEEHLQEFNSRLTYKIDLLPRPVPATERDANVLLAALPAIEEIRSAGPQQATFDVMLAGLQYWISSSTEAPSTGIQPLGSKVSARLVPGSGIYYQKSGSSPSIFVSLSQNAEGSHTFDPETGLVHSEAHVSQGDTAESEAQVEFDIVIDRYACWDPGLPEQRTATLSSRAAITAQTDQGVQDFVITADTSLTIFTDGGSQITSTVNYLDHEVSMDSGLIDGSGNPFSGARTNSNSDHSGQTTYAGGGSSRWSCPPGECSEDTLTKATDHLLELLETAMELLKLEINAEPGGDDFCLQLKVDPVEANLAPGGDELPIQVAASNWNKEPIEYARVSAPTAQLGILLPESGETSPDGTFQYTYTSDESGTETIPISLDYSFYQQQEQVVINIQDLWHFHMDFFIESDGKVQIAYDQDFAIGPQNELVTSERGTGIIISDWIPWECWDIDHGTSWPIEFLIDGALFFDLGGRYDPSQAENGTFTFTLQGDDPDFITTINDPTCNLEDENLATILVGGFAKDPFLYLIQDSITLPASHQAQETYQTPEFNIRATIEITRQVGDIP